MSALHDIPAVIFALFNDVDFFPTILAHITRVTNAGLAVETESPRIAHAKRPDFWQITFSTYERIVAGNGVRFCSVNVDTQYFCQKHFRILPIAVRVASGSTVAH